MKSNPTPPQRGPGDGKPAAGLKPAPARPAQTVTDATYYGVVTLTVLVGLLAYSSGATLEGTLVRSALALVACTTLGYVANIVLWLARNAPPAPAPAPCRAEPAHKPERAARPKIDMVADDDLETELARPPVALSR
jgi:hypothetical protein